VLPLSYPTKDLRVFPVFQKTDGIGIAKVGLVPFFLEWQRGPFQNGNTPLRATLAPTREEAVTNPDQCRIVLVATDAVSFSAVDVIVHPFL